MSTFNVTAQLSLPGWLRARALLAYILVSQGGLSVGSWFWGEIAVRFGTRVPLIAAGICAAATLLVALRFRLSPEDLRCTGLSAAVVTPLEPSDGPVMVQVKYPVAPEDRREFLAAMREIGQSHRGTESKLSGAAARNA